MRQKDFCNIVIFWKLLECNQYKKLDKEIFINYADLECLIEKINGCKNNPENSSATKVGEKFCQDFQCLQYHHLKA